MNDRIFSAVNIMIQTERMHKQLLDSKVSLIGIHRTHHRMLMHIARCNRLVSQKSLADHIGITPAAITGALKKLENNGYITRNHGADNRFNEVKITDEGKKIVEQTKELFSAVDATLFEDFTDEELLTYKNCLEKIQKNIKKHLDEDKENNNK